MIWITTHLVGTSNVQVFDIILSNNIKVDTRVVIDVTAQALNDTVRKMFTEGFTISSLADRVRGRSPNNAVSYTALFDKSNHLLETEMYLGDTVVDWKKRVVAMNSSGYRLISQSFVEFQDKEQVSTIFTRDRRLAYNITFEPPQKMFTFNNVSFFQFTTLALQYARKSYYLSHLEVNQREGDPSARFSAILLGHTPKTIRNGNWFRWGLNEEAVNSMIELESPNWDPHALSGYSHQGVLVYYVAFRRHVKN